MNGVDTQVVAVTEARPSNGRQPLIAMPPVVQPGQAPRQAPPAPAPASQRSRRSWPLVLLAAVIVLGVLGWIASEIWTAHQPPAALSASGTLEADEVSIASEVPGRLTAVLMEEGQSVHAGSVVARLDDATAQLQLQQAVSQADALQLAQLAASKYVIAAPRDGIITQVPVHQGEVISAGQMIGAVADLSTLKLTVWVLERDLGRVQVGQEVVITADPFQGRSFGGLVTSINPQAEFTPRNVQTQADRLNLVFGVNLRVDNVEGLLKAGMPVDATFPADE